MRDITARQWDFSFSTSSSGENEDASPFDDLFEHLQEISSQVFDAIEDLLDFDPTQMSTFDTNSIFSQEALPLANIVSSLLDQIPKLLTKAMQDIDGTMFDTPEMAIAASITASSASTFNKADPYPKMPGLYQGVGISQTSQGNLLFSRVLSKDLNLDQYEVTPAAPLAYPLNGNPIAIAVLEATPLGLSKRLEGRPIMYVVKFMEKMEVPKPSSNLSTGAILGIVLAVIGVVALCVGGGVFYYCCVWRKKRNAVAEMAKSQNGVPTKLSPASATAETSPGAVQMETSPLIQEGAAVEKM